MSLVCLTRLTSGGMQAFLRARGVAVLRCVAVLYEWGGRYYNLNPYLEAFEQKSLFWKFSGNPSRPGNTDEGKNGFM